MGTLITITEALVLLHWAWAIFNDRPRVRVTVRRTHIPTEGQDLFFVNTWNQTRRRDLEVTHVWFDCGRPIPVTQPAGELPRKLKRGQSCETWINVNEIPSDFRDHAYGLARVRLTTGAIIKSVGNENVPGSGNALGSQLARK
jgi:hypothetical protein